MRDEQYGDALILQLAHGGHQLLDLLLAQGRGGLVHDQQLGLQRNRLGDLHHLLQAHAQLAALRLGIDFGMAQHGQRLVGLLVHFRIVQEPVGLFLVAAHEHVVHHRQHRHDVQLLIHAGDAGLAGLHRIGEGNLVSVDVDFTLFGNVHAGQHFDQRGFARAVLANQAVNLAGLDLNMHVVHGDDAGKALGDMLQLHHVFRHWSITLLIIGLEKTGRSRD